MLRITNGTRTHLTTLLASLALAGCAAGDDGRQLGDGFGLTGAEPESEEPESDEDEGDEDEESTDEGDGDGDAGGTEEDDGDTSEGAGGDTGDDGDTEDDEDSSDTGAEEDLVPCETASATLEPIPPNIHLVLDKSGSMVNATNNWDHDGDPGTPEVTRWYSLYEVVESVTSGLDQQVNFGAVLFPSKSAESVWSTDACIVEDEPDVTVGPGNATAILDAIPDKTAGTAQIAGGTPATSGLALAYDDLAAQDGDNPPAVIFVTDGAANCSEGQVEGGIFNVYDDDLLPLVTEAWQTDGIPTYVVGIGIDNETTPEKLDGNPDLINPHEKLEELAVAGGKPNPAGPPTFYQANSQAELQAALQQAIDDSMSCIVELDPLPPYPEKTKVFVGDEEIPEITDCATEDGWMYAPAAEPWDKIELCGSACDDLKEAGDLLVEYYCLPG
jgi:hypothetical protein